MRRMMKKIFLGVLGVLAAAIVIVLIIASTKATEFSVERKATLAAPPTAVYVVMSDLRRFKDWSPWQEMDPNMATTFTGTAYRTTGSAWLGVPYNPAALVPNAVGSVTFRFVDRDNAFMSYTIDGVTQTKSITRQPF